MTSLVIIRFDPNPFLYSFISASHPARKVVAWCLVRVRETRGMKERESKRREAMRAGRNVKRKRKSTQHVRTGAPKRKFVPFGA